MKKTLAFICVLTLVMSLCSVFTFAATPEAGETTSAGDNARYATYYKVNQSRTYMYVSASPTSGYVRPAPIPVNSQVTFISASGSFYKVSFYDSDEARTYTGYIQSYRLTALN